MWKRRLPRSIGPPSVRDDCLTKILDMMIDYSDSHIRGQDGDKGCSWSKRILDSMVSVGPNAPLPRILAAQTSNKTRQFIRVTFPIKHLTASNNSFRTLETIALMSGKHSHNRTGDCPDDLPHEEGRVASRCSLVSKWALGNICSTEDRVDQRGGIILPEIFGHQVMTIGNPALM